MAAATQRIRLTANFANNLFRSPVEFAQASLTMQRASHGRWEAGFGAGWAQEELESTGQTYPTPRRRADRYIEAVQVVRQLFHTNRCSFSGEHYNINVPALAGFENLTPPPLIGSLGGPRTIAGATPYLDRVELMPATGVARGGELDWAAIAAIPKQRLIDLIDQVRRAKEDVDLTFGALCGLGDDIMSKNMTEKFTDDSLYGSLFGTPERVAEGLFDLQRYGISRVSIVLADPTAYASLAAHLFTDKSAPVGSSARLPGNRPSSV